MVLHSRTAPGCGYLSRLALAVIVAFSGALSAAGQSPADVNNDQNVDLDDWGLALPCIFGPDHGIPGLDNALLWDDMAGDRLAAQFDTDGDGNSGAGLANDVDFNLNPVTLSFQAIKRRTGGGRDYLVLGESAAGTEVFRLRWANDAVITLSTDGGSSETVVFNTGVAQSYLNSSTWDPSQPWTIDVTLDSSGIDVQVQDAAGNSGGVENLPAPTSLLGQIVFTSPDFATTFGIWLDNVHATAAGLGEVFADDFNSALVGPATLSGLRAGIDNDGHGSWQADAAELEAADAGIVAAPFAGSCQPSTFARMDFDGDADVDLFDVGSFNQAFASAIIEATTVYYVDADGGSDDNPGTSLGEAWATLARASLEDYGPGDSILLQAGDTFTGKLLLSGVNGTDFLPIVVASYGTGPKPIIDAAGYFAGVELEDVDFVEVRDLEITADGGMTVDGSDATKRSGVHVAAGNGNFSHITIRDLYIHDIYPELDTPSEGVNPTTYFGYGVRTRGNNRSPYIRIQGCRIERVGFKAIELNDLSFVEVLDNDMKDIGGPAIQPGRVDDLLMRGNVVDGSGAYVDPRMHGRGSGTWPWTCERVLIEKNAFMHARGKADSCGAHIDFNCRDVVVQYNFSYDNEGGFVEILGNNQNCAYRYNISVNDGTRVQGVNGAAQWGYTIFTSGYVGENNPRNGPYNSYIYNNTIYTSQEQAANFSLHETTDGLLIANNVFYITGSSADVTPGNLDDWTADLINRVDWRNNLYQRTNVIPPSLPFTDTAPFIGDPNFACPGGSEPLCYVPQDAGLIVDAGINIAPIPGDSVGLQIGLAATEDFFGNPITGAPDLGAVELSGASTFPLIDEDFSAIADPVNLAAPYPATTWHLSNASEWDREDASQSSSVIVTSGEALRTGWGYDETVVRYYLNQAWDMDGSEYVFEGTWEIENILDVHLGLIVGFGEYDPNTGELLRRIKEVTVGATSAPTVGQTGGFSLPLSSAELQAASVSNANCVGVFIHHDDEGTLFDDPWTQRNDVYLVDDLRLVRVAAE